MIPVLPDRMLDIVRNIQTLQLTIMLSLISGASAAFTTELVRGMFFCRATWQDKFHFMVVVVCWVVLFLVQLGLVILGAGT
jgi:hypothetical protein